MRSWPSFRPNSEMLVTSAAILTVVLLGVGGCSGAGSGDEGGTSEAADSNEVSAGETNHEVTLRDLEPATCGEWEFSVQELSAASGRLDDAALGAINASGAALGAPERWSVLRSDASVLAVIDPVALGGREKNLYWVRVLRVGGLTYSFDGGCRFGPDPAASSTQVSNPSRCDVEVDETVPGLMPVWTGADPGALLIVKRDGTEIYRRSPGGDTLIAALDERRAEHGEAPGVGGVDLGADPADAGFLDTGVEAGDTHRYSVQATNAEGQGPEPLECGEATAPAGTTAAIECSVVLDEAGWPAVIWSATSVDVVVVRDGAPLAAGERGYVAPFVDRSAPVGREVAYALDVAGAAAGDSQGAPLPCGSVTVTAAPVGSVDLQAVAADNAQRHAGPFEYVTLEPICSTCEGQTVDIYLVPGSGGEHEVETVWINGIETTPEGVWLVDPLFVADRLLEAEADGRTINWTVDPQSGLINSWKVGGEGAVLICLELDTRPIDLRDGEGCGAANLLD